MPKKAVGSASSLFHRYFLPYSYNFVEHVLALNTFYYYRKRTKETTEILCFCLFRALALIFHFKLYRFCWWGSKNIFVPGRGKP